MRIFSILFIAAVLSSCSAKKEKVDRLLFNGVIYTVDSAFTISEALAIKDGKIVATGKSDELLSKFVATNETSDLHGAAVFPGFIDAHCHFLSYGLGLSRIDLVGTHSWREVIQRVADAISRKSGEKNADPLSRKKDTWVVGRGWDQNDWDIKEMPDNRALDSVAGDLPVLLTRIDGHAALASTAALRLAKIEAGRKIAGGEVVMRNGRPTGLLVDNAVDLVKSVMPAPSFEMKREALLQAQANCFAAGLTTVDDAGLMYDDIDMMDSLQRSGTLKMRVYAMLSDSAPNYARYETGPRKTDRLNVRCFKLYGDGALGSRGACLLQPYADKPGWSGFLLSSPQHFADRATWIAAHLFQMATHCIGDSAYRLMLTVYRNAGATKRNRWRIEHAQVVNENDFARSKEIIPSVQPTHATSDMYWAADRLGNERVKGAYAYKQLLDAAGVIALGTDFPVEDISPFSTFYAAVARRDTAGYPPGGFQPANALTREQALRGMTAWAAYSNFEENEKGSIEKGKFADLIILDTDLMKCTIEDVLKAKVMETVVGGESVYRRKPGRSR